MDSPCPGMSTIISRHSLGRYFDMTIHIVLLPEKPCTKRMVGVGVAVPEKEEDEGSTEDDDEDDDLDEGVRSK